MKKPALITLLVLAVLAAALLLIFRSSDKVETKNDTSAPVETSMIKVFSPLPGANISSPVLVRGEARGQWYFEASFPVRLLDANGRELGVVVAQAQGEWMTTEFVPFQTSLSFQTPTTATGTLVLERDNPSGLPEHADEVRIPVRFSQSGASKTPIQDAVRALLAKWNLSSVTLVGANVENGILTLEFDDPLNQTSGGSARVIEMREEIEAAVKKFPGVNQVRFRPIGVFES